MTLLSGLCAVALLVLAAGCGHKDAQSTTSTTTTVQTPSAAAPVGAVSTGVPAAGAGGTTASAAGDGNPPGFTDEAAAKAHCATDEVVWLNTRSKIYHAKGTRYYGTTKQGEYACRKEADAAGDRNSKS